MTEASPIPDARRILVVEDEYFLADDLVRALARGGLQVVGPVATLGGAERLLEDEPIDCAILDINLRGEMAFPIADRLDAVGIPYLFATGYSRVSIPDRFSGVGHVEKPFDAEHVVAMLSEAIRAATGPRPAG
jgi:DNA-binding response OmpR family regulator